MSTFTDKFSPWSKDPIRPSHHITNALGATTFHNPWPSADAPTWTELLTTKWPLGWYDDLAKKHPGIKDVKVITPDWGSLDLKKRGLEREKCVVATSLGHAGVITEIKLQGTGGKSFWTVYDPIFSARAGPTQYTGPLREKPPPCQVTDLPGCDAIMISHNHYDHLDLATVEALMKKFPQARYFVPLGNKSWLSSLGVKSEMVFELDWWDNREFSVQDLGFTTTQNASQDTLLRITCVPAQHNSGRGALDQGATLWCGWVIEQLVVSKDEAEASKAKRYGAIYHAGDTGYRRTAKSDAVCPIFKEIGQKFGSFELSFLPIWRGGSLGFVSSLGVRLKHNDIPSALHASPADAIEIHKDVLSRNSMAIHFGTFVGSEDESLESIMDFEESREQGDVLGLDDQAFSERGRAGIVDIGASLAVEINVHDVDA